MNEVLDLLGLEKTNLYWKMNVGLKRLDSYKIVEIN